MLLSLNWIKAFIPLQADAEEVVNRLAMAGLESEIVREPGKGLDDFVVSAAIRKTEPHPNADRLTLCEVDDGQATVPVVCGAKNMKVGDKVVLARPGSQLPGGMKIKVSKIRKVESQGMLCSPSELGLAEESEGIMILPEDTPLGLPIVQVLKLPDAILDVEVTPNRGDCLSIQGMVREISANFKIPFTGSQAPKVEPGSGASGIAVKLQAPEQCGRYTCRVLKGIKVKASPQWMVSRLEACGIRSINNVVDATNYVMLETGQPLHAFDLKEIRGAQVQIRLAAKGEVMKTLDGQERKLNPEDLVIADGERVLALAGVMGGEDSGVNEATKDLLLESAWFMEGPVRRSARRLSLQTESSYRFERGVDPNGCVLALDRLTELLLQVAGGQVHGATEDVYPNPVPPSQIKLRPARIEKVLGIAIPAEEILEPLAALGIQDQGREGEAFLLEVPTFRTDLTREIDLIEEVARLYDYERIPATYPKLSLQSLQEKGESPLTTLKQIRELFTGWGFHEVLHYSFTSPELLATFDQGFAPEQVLLNPISEDLSVMRPALFPQMVQTLKNNIYKGNQDLRLFEMRPVYLYEKSGKDSGAFQQSWRLSLGMSGSRRPLHFLEKEAPALAEEFTGLNLLDLKGYLEALVRIRLSGARLKALPGQAPYFYPKRQSELSVKPPEGAGEAQALGIMGQLHPRLMTQWDLPVPVLVAEIYLDLFLTEWENSIQFREISPFPTVWRDLNLIVAEATPSGEVQEVIRAHGGPWLKRAELFDVYRGQPLQSGSKALTYRLEYGTGERTLTDDEVNGAREQLLEKLNQQLGVTLR